jgi:ribokinase
MPRVVVLGASLMDMNMRLDRLPAPGETRLGSEFFLLPGGKGANQAVAARRAGADVLLLTAFGEDHLGVRIRDNLFAEKVDLDHALVVPGASTGVALILVDGQGENLIGVAMGANATLTPDFIDALPPAVFEGPGAFLASLEVPLETVARAVARARAGGLTVVVNPAPAAPELFTPEFLKQIDVLTPNESECEALVGSKEPKSLNMLHGLPDVVVTLGAEGCVVFARDGPFTKLEAFPVEVVDTVGAGDAFSAVLAVGLAEGLSLVEAAYRANAGAAIAVTGKGAQGALPTAAQIHEMVLRRPRP